MLGLLEQADGEGLDIVAQVAGRSIGILYCLHGSVHPLLFHPAYAEVADLPMPARLAALADPERRRRLVHDVPDDGGFFQRVVLDKVDRMWPVDGPDIDYEPDASTSVAAVARRPRASRRWRCCSTSSPPTTATGWSTRRSSTTATATCR